MGVDSEDLPALSPSYGHEIAPAVGAKLEYSH